MCSLSTTSISGKDDLVISARNPWWWGDGYSGHSHAEAFGIFRYDGNTMQQVVRSDLAYKGERLVSTSSTDADLNGNGVEELLVGGNWDTGDGIDKKHNGLMAYCWNTEKGGYEAAWSEPKKLNANDKIRVGHEMHAPTAIAAAHLVMSKRRMRRMFTQCLHP